MTTEEGLIVNSSTISEVLNEQRVDKWAYRNNHSEHRPVSFLSESEINAMLDYVKVRRNGSRNDLILSLLFQAALRVTEALDLRFRDRQKSDGKYILFIEHGKGDKPRLLAIPESLYMKIGN